MSACCSSAGSSSAISGRFYLTVVFLVSRFFVLSDERMKWVEVPAAAVGGVCWSTWTMSGSSMVTSLQQMEYTESLSTISSERDACWRQCSSICTVSGAVPSTSGSECTVSCAPFSFVSASVPTIYTLESWQHATHSSLSGHALPYLADDIHLVLTAATLFHRQIVYHSTHTQHIRRQELRCRRATFGTVFRPFFTTRTLHTTDSGVNSKRFCLMLLRYLHKMQPIAKLKLLGYSTAHKSSQSFPQKKSGVEF